MISELFSFLYPPLSYFLGHYHLNGWYCKSQDENEKLSKTNTEYREEVSQKGGQHYEKNSSTSQSGV
jgi:hypothetical protein